MKIAEAAVCWTPDRREFPSGMRGKVRVFTAPGGKDDIAPFPRRGGYTDSRAHDGLRERREVYALMLFFVMTQRDGLAVPEVHRAMLAIDEYQSACSELYLEETPQ